MSTHEEIPAPPSKTQLEIIHYHGAYPLWKFLLQKFGIDIREVCERIAKDEPFLPIDEKKLALRTVNHDYVCTLDSSYDQDKTFLLNCCNAVFNILKEGIVKNGEHILKPYSFSLDEHGNMSMISSDGSLESYNDSIKLGVVDAVDV